MYFFKSYNSTSPQQYLNETFYGSRWFSFFPLHFSLVYFYNRAARARMKEKNDKRQFNLNFSAHSCLLPCPYIKYIIRSLRMLRVCFWRRPCTEHKIVFQFLEVPAKKQSFWSDFIHLLDRESEKNTLHTLHVGLVAIVQLTALEPVDFRVSSRQGSY